ncbi:hypothetical protein BOX37_01665 [Nocardia mangyaensis]|uniref:Uncharacterized protein n=1 Tax=Nocardia mangyaensis TaxID=2213200 RepID=A0A1J0VLI0_9NOCA|nr:hypothetical protein BOX37_01665 [Nocardia mangyaensis]
MVSLIATGGVASAEPADRDTVASPSASSDSDDLGSVVGIPLFLLSNFIQNQICTLASSSGAEPCQYRGPG